MSAAREVAVAEAELFVASLFAAAGLAAPAAQEMAEALIEAERSGQSSHGLVQLEMYLRRLRLGSVSAHVAPVEVLRRGGTAVLDARAMFGHLAGRHAMELATELAAGHGIAAVAVRNSFHFGAAGRYAQMASARGCMGLAMCNTKPMMAAPGGVDPLVGNNPLAIGIPAPEPDFLLDMAMSAAALGRIRGAAMAGTPIPDSWALDAAGEPTTDPQAAIAGTLQPAGGAKGFGLALAVDLMSSLLADGPGGAEVAPLYGDLARPFLCSLLFIAIDPGHFGDAGAMRERAGHELARIRNARSRGAPLRTPGERAATRRRTTTLITVPGPLVQSLDALAQELGTPMRLGGVG
jgi:LDH2 family malate/lactate/ureidoglycolate dehydrogenase